MKLEMRCIEIPRSPLAILLEKRLGRRLDYQFRHYLNGDIVTCGTVLECWDGDVWIRGQYEWSGVPTDLPTFRVGERVVIISSAQLLRWPR